MGNPRPVLERRNSSGGCHRTEGKGKTTRNSYRGHRFVSAREIVTYRDEARRNHTGRKTETRESAATRTARCLKVRRAYPPAIVSVVCLLFWKTSCGRCSSTGTRHSPARKEVNQEMGALEDPVRYPTSRKVDMITKVLLFRWLNIGSPDARVRRRDKATSTVRRELLAASTCFCSSSSRIRDANSSDSTLQGTEH